jgi:hypothetical protein
MAQNKKYAGFEVLTEVLMKSSIFWDITPCSPLKLNSLLRKKCQNPSSGHCFLPVHAGFLLGLLFNSEMEATCSRNVG